MIALAALVALLPLAGALAVLVRPRARAAGWALVAGSAGAFASSLVMLARVVHSGHFSALEGFVYVDSLSAFFAATVSFVVLLASLGSAAYLRTEEDRGVLSSFQVRLYFVFFSIFASGMLASFLAGNLGLLWVLIEASTLASAVLVGLEGKGTSLEAAWKYVIVSSFGVTVALLGTVFLFYSASALHLGATQGLTWVFLFDRARRLAPASLRLAFLLAVVGYGTKVGLVPMHTWLPDAHSEAPSPASAMLSAGLLNTGMYAIIRFRAIAVAGIGGVYPGNVLLVFGFASVFVGVIFMVRRGNFKRMFAYSSIEHMGIISVALGFGGILGMYGALLQTLNHAIGKSVLFLSSGYLVLGYHTRESTKVRGVLQALPLAGAALLLASFAVAGSPPFGVFLSELTIVRSGFAGGAPVLAGLLLVLLAIGFVALFGAALSMAAGERSAVERSAGELPAGAGPAGEGPAGEGPAAGAFVAYPLRSSRVLAGAPLVAGLAALGILGLWIPAGLNTVIMHSIRAMA